MRSWWPSGRRRGPRRGGAPERPGRGAYDAIRWVLSELGDGHSFLRTQEEVRAAKAASALSFGLTALFPERVVVDVEPGGGAERAGARVGDIVESVDGRPVQGDGTVRLPAPMAGGRPARTVLGLLRVGGTGPAPPVAVLTSRLTASAGEAVVMAFRGRSGARSFGEATAGVPTGNAHHRLADGAELYLTGAIGVDRTSRTYRTRIRPDQPVATGWTRYGTAADPVLRTATTWLDAHCP